MKTINSNTLDTRLIDLLQQNGRQSYQALALQLEVSINTVKRHVEQLVKDKIIRIAAAVDPTRVGYPVELAMMFNVRHGRLDPVFKELARQTVVHRISKVIGRFDIIALVRLQRTEEISVFYQEILANISGIRDIETYVSLRNEKQRYILMDWTYIDSPYKKLIGLLQEDGRRSYTSLSEDLGVSRSIVQRAMQKLIRERIIHISAVVNPEKIGLPVAAGIGLHIKPEKLESIINSLGKQTAIMYITKMTGRYDTFAFGRFSSHYHLSDFNRDVLGKLAGIRDFETFVFLETLLGPIYGGSVPG